MMDLVIQAFDAVIQREVAEADEVREEIKRRGTYWAGDEIWKLRRQVKTLRKRLAELEGGSQVARCAGRRRAREPTLTLKPQPSACRSSMARMRLPCRDTRQAVVSSVCGLACRSDRRTDLCGLCLGMVRDRSPAPLFSGCVYAPHFHRPTKQIMIAA